eukprot:Platyproteum_vivax@DN12590_c0_g1_i1.p1
MSICLSGHRIRYHRIRSKLADPLTPLHQTQNHNLLTPAPRRTTIRESCIRVYSFGSWKEKKTSWVCLCGSQKCACAFNGHDADTKDISIFEVIAKAKKWSSSSPDTRSQVVDILKAGRIKIEVEYHPRISAKAPPHCSQLIKDPPPINLEDAIESYQRPQSLGEINCDCCNKRAEVTEQRKIWSRGPYFFVQLGRFQTHPEPKKNDVQVNYPFSLALKQASGISENMQLYGVVHHIGSMRQGHYWSDICIEGEWFKFEDEKAGVPIPKQGEERLTSPTAYLLCYKAV